MNQLPLELEAFLKSKSEFTAKLNDLQLSSLESMRHFVNAKMDDHRNFYAEQLAELSLRVTDMEELSVFRKAVLRRELTTDMDYPKHRDHAVHTVHNYLLGFYFKEHCQPFVEAYAQRRRYFTREGFGSFMEEWQFASLVHDIGYIFEGSASAPYEEVSRKTLRSFHFVRDYFNRTFWEDLDIKSDCLFRWRELCEYRDVIHDATTTGSVASYLQQILPIKHVCEWLNSELPEDYRSVMNKFEGRACSAFDLWEAYYEGLGEPDNTMLQAIKNARKKYREHADSGLTAELHLIDHGVASALVLFRNSTQFFNLYRQISGDPCFPERGRLVEHRSLSQGAPYDIKHWWDGIVPATAACAVHNFRPENPLFLKDSPIAYLGILVDVLQEWDRPSSSRKVASAEDLPLSSHDVKLGHANGKVVISYPRHRALKDKIMSDLNPRLASWKDLVVIEEHD